MNRLFLFAFGSSLLAGTAAAQTTLPFTIDGPASQFSYGGTTSVGPIVGNPSTFGLTGTVDARLSAGLLGSPVGTIEFVPTGVATITPDINASIPNVFPFLPPLATISITGFALTLDSDPIAVGPTGAFTGMMSAAVVSGMLTITPLGGTATVTDLTGTANAPQAVSGTVGTAGATIALDAPLDLSFILDDPNGAFSASVTLVGDVAADYSTPAITTYCAVEPNSTGAPAVIGTSGTSSLSSGNLELTAGSLPTNTFGYFLFAQEQGFVPLFGGSSGNLCLSGQLFRLSGFVLSSGDAGQVSLPVPFGALPQGNVFDIGDTRNFQYWFRDQGSAPTSNTTGGLNVTFAP